MSEKTQDRDELSAIYFSDTGVAHTAACCYCSQSKPLDRLQPEGWDVGSWDGLPHPWTTAGQPGIAKLTLAWVRPCQRCRPDLRGSR